MLEGDVTIVVLGDREAADVSVVSLVSNTFSVFLGSTLLVKVVCRDTSEDLDLVEGSWVCIANPIDVSEIVAVAKVSVIPSEVVGTNVENWNIPTTSNIKQM